MYNEQTKELVSFNNVDLIQSKARSKHQEPEIK